MPNIINEIDVINDQTIYEYFNLTSDPRLTIFHDDARVFINQTQNKYDVIFGDASENKNYIKDLESGDEEFLYDGDFPIIVYKK